LSVKLKLVNNTNKKSYILSLLRTRNKRTGTHTKIKAIVDTGRHEKKLDFNMHHLRGNAIPAGPLSDSDEILCR